jgi:hypothetical protein
VELNISRSNNFTLRERKVKLLFTRIASATTHSGGKNVVDLLANCFQAIYSNEVTTHVRDNNSIDPELEDSAQRTLGKGIEITREEIHSKLRELSTHKGGGPNGLPGTLLKFCAAALIPPLFILFNKSLRTSEFPAVWRISYVTPIHRSGDKSNAENYRPISVLNIIPKIFESILKDKITPILDPVISRQQHGFVSGRSVTSNLALYTQYLLTEMENGCQVDAVYTHFSKAFDKVSIQNSYLYN